MLLKLCLLNLLSKRGVSYIAKRYAKANNKYMNDYNLEELSTVITYLDKNNLFGWAMSEYLPYENLSGYKMLMSLMLCQLIKKVM